MCKKEKVIPKIKYKNLKINNNNYYYFIFGITFPFAQLFNLKLYQKLNIKI